MSPADAIVELKREDVLAEVQRRVEGGEDPLRIIADCQDGMVLMGDRYNRGDFFLAELVLAGSIFTAVFDMLEPYLTATTSGTSRGTVILATPKGDIHDLGKNIVATMLKSHGFEVHDLGVNVEPGTIVAKVRELRPQFVGFSALLTTALTPLKEAIDKLTAEGLRDEGCKVLIGGGATTPYVEEYMGADFQTTDVMEGVQYCLSLRTSSLHVTEGRKARSAAASWLASWATRRSRPLVADDLGHCAGAGLDVCRLWNGGGRLRSQPNREAMLTRSVGQIGHFDAVGPFAAETLSPETRGGP